MNELTLYAYYDGGDTVVAYSPEDASTVWSEWAGGEPHSDDEHPWDARPMGDALRIRMDEAEVATVRTVAEWIAGNGRGFLCSENW